MIMSIGRGIGAAALAAALALGATQAVAQMVMVEQPGAEARIAGRDVTCVVRYGRDEGDRFKVEADFYRPFAADKLAQMQIELAQGESFAYSPPADDAPTYRFARDGDVLIVTVHRPSRLRLTRQ
jgi:hypothetical protein